MWDNSREADQLQPKKKNFIHCIHRLTGPMWDWDWKVNQLQ